MSGRTAAGRAYQSLGKWRWRWTVAWAVLFRLTGIMGLVASTLAAHGGEWSKAAYWLVAVVLLERWSEKESTRAGLKE